MPTAVQALQLLANIHKAPLMALLNTAQPRLGNFTANHIALLATLYPVLYALSRCVLGAVRALVLAIMFGTGAATLRLLVRFARAAAATEPAYGTALSHIILPQVRYKQAARSGHQLLLGRTRS